jgi:hypothetical protein
MQRGEKEGNSTTDKITEEGIRKSYCSLIKTWEIKWVGLTKFQ